MGLDLPGLVFVVRPDKFTPRTGFDWAYKIRKFVNYSITKYIKSQATQTCDKNIHFFKKMHEQCTKQFLTQFT